MLTSGMYGYLGDYLLFWALFLSLLANTWCFFRLLPPPKRPRVRLVVGNVLVFTCLLGFVSLAIESHLRFVSVRTDAFGMSLPAKRWFAVHTQLNSLGCRDKEWTLEKPTGTRRIAFVGDSYTYGWGVERIEDRFPDRIQAMFNHASPRHVEVMNVAKPGWDTSAQLTPIADMIARYEVDEVVLCYVPNDIEKLLPRTPEFDPIRPPEPVLMNIYSSCLVDYMYRSVWLPLTPTVHGYHDWLAEGFADAEILRRHQEQLVAMMRICKEARRADGSPVTFRVALLPFVVTGGEKFHAKALHATLRKFFEANGVEMVDLLPALADHSARELIVNSQDAHPNEFTHSLFADAIWKTFYAKGTP